MVGRASEASGALSFFPPAIAARAQLDDPRGASAPAGEASPLAPPRRGPQEGGRPLPRASKTVFSRGDFFPEEPAARHGGELDAGPLGPDLVQGCGRDQWRRASSAPSSTTAAAATSTTRARSSPDPAANERPFAFRRKRTASEAERSAPSAVPPRRSDRRALAGERGRARLITPE